jgi:hypothetical protein
MLLCDAKQQPFSLFGVPFVRFLCQPLLESSERGEQGLPCVRLLLILPGLKKNMVTVKNVFTG